MLKQLFFTVGVPMLLTSVLLFGGYLLYIFTDSWRPMDWAGAAGFGLSFFVAFCLINGGIPEFPPAASVNWIAYFALITALLGPFEREIPVPEWGRWIGRVLLMGLGISLLLYPVLKHSSAGVALAWIVGSSVGALLTWGAVIQLDDQMDGYVVPLSYLLCSTFASLLLVGALQYGSMAQYAGAFATICGVFTGASILNRSRSVLGGARPALLVLFPMMLLGGWFYASDVQSGAWPFLLLAVLPVCVSLGLMPFLKQRLSRWTRGLSGVLSIFVLGSLLTGAVWFVQQETGSTGSNGDSTDTYEDYGE
jgi:hypothetical protein